MFHTKNSPALFSEYGNWHCSRLMKCLVLEGTYPYLRDLHCLFSQKNVQCILPLLCEFIPFLIFVNN